MFLTFYTILISLNPTITFDVFEYFWKNVCKNFCDFLLRFVNDPPLLEFFLEAVKFKPKNIKVNYYLQFSYWKFDFLHQIDAIDFHEIK